MLVHALCLVYCRIKRIFLSVIYRQMVFVRQCAGCRRRDVYTSTETVIKYDWNLFVSTPSSIYTMKRWIAVVDIIIHWNIVVGRSRLHAAWSLLASCVIFLIVASRAADADEAEECEYCTFHVLRLTLILIHAYGSHPSRLVYRLLCPASRRSPGRTSVVPLFSVTPCYRSTGCT